MVLGHQATEMRADSIRTLETGGLRYIRRAAAREQLPKDLRMIKGGG